MIDRTPLSPDEQRGLYHPDYLALELKRALDVIDAISSDPYVPVEEDVAAIKLVLDGYLARRSQALAA